MSKALHIDRVYFDREELSVAPVELTSNILAQMNKHDFHRRLYENVRKLLWQALEAGDSSQEYYWERIKAWEKS